MTEHSLVPRHIIPLLPEVADVWQTGEIICHNIVVAGSMLDLELEGLQGEVPMGELAVVIFHGIHPDQSMMVGL